MSSRDKMYIFQIIFNTLNVRKIHFTDKFIPIKIKGR